MDSGREPGRDDSGCRGRTAISIRPIAVSVKGIVKIYFGAWGFRSMTWGQGQEKTRREAAGSSGRYFFSCVLAEFPNIMFRKYPKRRGAPGGSAELIGIVLSYLVVLI